MSNVNVVSARAPTKYSGSTKNWAAPSPSWMSRTWMITHSTLKSRANARNCRTTISASSPGADGKIKLSQTTKMETKGKVSKSSSTSTATKKADATGEFESKGKGLIKSSSKWEILGWGDITDESGNVVESWMIVYYGSGEGVEVLSSRREGLGSETAHRCLSALKRMPDAAYKLKNSIVMDLRVVEIAGPWKE